METGPLKNTPDVTEYRQSASTSTQDDTVARSETGTGADLRSTAHRSAAPQVSQAFRPDDPPSAAASITTTTPQLEPTFITLPSDNVQGMSTFNRVNIWPDMLIPRGNQSTVHIQSPQIPTSTPQLGIPTPPLQYPSILVNADGLVNQRLNFRAIDTISFHVRQTVKDNIDRGDFIDMKSLLPSENQAAIEGCQRQGRQSNPSSTQEGAVATSSTDTSAVIEENQQQGLQSISTTTHNYIGCSVSQYDLSNSSQTSEGNPGHRGCVSQASLSIRIKQLNEGFEEIGTLHKAEELLKRHNHVTVCGAPGDGKTSIALKMCEKYLRKKYEVVFVENVEEFQEDTIIQRQCHMLIVFDDIFGSGPFPSNVQKIKKVLARLADVLVNISVQMVEQDKKKREQKN